MGEDRGAAVAVAAAVESRKRARGASGSEDLERVAEIVMVLSAIGQIRAGRDPSAAEMTLMVEAREKLAKFCESLDFPRRKNLFTKEMAMALVVDHGLNPAKENVPRPPKLSIAEKVAITKKKMEEAREIAAQSPGQPSQLLSVSFGAKAEGRSSIFPGAQRIFPDKQSSSPSGGVQTSALTSSPSSLKHIHQNEIRRGLSPMKSSLTPAVSQLPEKTMGPSPQGYPHTMNKELDTKIPVAYQLSPGASFHDLSLPSSGNHSDISKMVQRLLPGRSSDQPLWTPPSTDYMNRPINCQICKVAINDVESLLVCDACEKGVHMRCLLSFNQRIIPKAEWHCPQCLISSSGKPLPPKYGRVTRSVTASRSSPIVQQTESKVNSQPSAKKTTNPRDEHDVDLPSSEASTENNLGSGLLPCQMHQQACDPIHDGPMDIDPPSHEHNDPSVISDIDAHDGSKDSSHLLNVPDHVDLHDVKNDLQAANSDIPRKYADDELLTSENAVIPEEISERDCSRSSSSLQAAEWIGGSIRTVEESSYYHSLSINGVVYRLQDHVLISSDDGTHLPSKIQALWEDSRSGAKWVSVHCYFYPSDLPESVQKPATPGNVEVYYTELAKTVSVESIIGPCQVISEESQAGDSGSNQTFICRWSYDASEGLLRSLTQ